MRYHNGSNSFDRYSHRRLRLLRLRKSRLTNRYVPGGSGFIAAHVLNILLARGHSVVTTVRTGEKAQRIRDAHPDVPKEKLDFVIVPDIADPSGTFCPRGSGKCVVCSAVRLANNALRNC